MINKQISTVLKITKSLLEEGLPSDNRSANACVKQRKYISFFETAILAMEKQNLSLTKAYCTFIFPILVGADERTVSSGYRSIAHYFCVLMGFEEEDEGWEVDEAEKFEEDDLL